MQAATTTAHPGRPLAVLTLAAAMLSAAVWSAERRDPGDDPREIFNSGSPAWLQAVGALRVPGTRYEQGRRRNLQEDCSATLVTAAAGRDADTIVTAWHCLASYDDLSKPITFTLPGGRAGPAVFEVYRLADGGGMHADWAILRLYRPIAARQAPALPVHPGRADAGRSISMAGYSRDGGKGASGGRLTFDPLCRITVQETASSHSDCRAHKGASGGAVVQSSSGGDILFTGVVSQGDGAGVSIFVPVSSFRRSLYRYLR